MDLPLLVYHRLAGMWSGIGGEDAKGIELKSSPTPIESPLSNAAAALPAVTRAGKTIQRRSVAGGSSAAGGFFPSESRGTPGSPVLREISPPQKFSAPVALPTVGRLSFSEWPPEKRLPAPAEFERSDSIVESGEMSRRSWQFRTPAAAPASEADPGHVGETAASRTGPALSHMFGGTAVLKALETRPGVVRHAAGKFISKTLATFSGKSARTRSGSSKISAGSRSPMLRLVQTAGPEALDSEIFWRDIRVNRPDRAGNLPFERESPFAPSWEPPTATSPAAPSLDLTLQLPRTSVAKERAASAVAATPQRSVLAGDEVAARAMNSETRPPAAAPVLSVPEVADKVYRLLERRLTVERERRGVFRS